MKEVTESKDKIIEVHDLTVSYDRKPVLWGVDLYIPKGVVCGIVGPNGAGKSTLLKSIMGLLPIDSGYIKLFGKSIEEVRKTVSYIPQRGAVDWDFPANVYDVALMGRYPKLGLFQRPKKADKEATLYALEQVGMEKFIKRQISQLSGGQQQRVFIARALAQEADLYFMDEPFAGVDAATEKTLVTLFQKLTQQGKTIIIVHHEIQSVQSYFQWLILLNVHLIASGDTHEVFTQENIKKAYGANLTILSELRNKIKEIDFPIREQ